MNMMKHWIRAWVLFAGCSGLLAAHALTPQLAMEMAVGESDSRIQAIGKALEAPDANTAALLQAMADETAKVFADAVWVVDQGQARNATTGETRALPDDAQDIMLNNRMRSEIDAALAALKLFSPDAQLRIVAAQAMLKEPDAARKPMLEKALASESQAEVQAWLKSALAAVNLSDAVAATRMAAVKVLAQSARPDVLLLLNQQLTAEQDVAVKTVLKVAILQVQDGLKWGERLGILFTGLSLGSILMLVALGLALQLPWNRIIIVAFSLAVLAAVALMIGRTRLGLFVRGVTQNRPMASCMGVNTARIDTYAFALGSGIAGLAGCALSQIGNVGPDLGQSYIVDSFMVVVLGGVGQLAGTVYAALGLGLLNKVLEGWAGAVLAKIAVLVFIIVFIQKRPQGIFAMKGRSAEA
ncbi:MAG: hypothetical protein EBV79_08460 [Betaproteobacteria bacterium]|nr:hypothetical protein [Betaproteobacteria bacterium]